MQLYLYICKIVFLQKILARYMVSMRNIRRINFIKKINQISHIYYLVEEAHSKLLLFQLYAHLFIYKICDQQIK